MHALTNCEDSFIQATLITRRGGEWNFVFAKPTEGIHMVMKNGVLTKMDGFFEIHCLPGHKSQETIKSLIRKKVLVPTMSNKEFAVQFALGTIDYRDYKLTGKCITATKDFIGK